MATKLTKRELDVLMRAAWSDADTANQLGLSPKTVRLYWIKIFNKLNTHSKAQSAIKALRLDLISKYQFVI